MRAPSSAIRRRCKIGLEGLFFSDSLYTQGLAAAWLANRCSPDGRDWNFIGGSHRRQGEEASRFATSTVRGELADRSVRGADYSALHDGEAPLRSGLEDATELGSETAKRSQHTESRGEDYLGGGTSATCLSSKLEASCLVRSRRRHQSRWPLCRADDDSGQNRDWR